MKAWVLAAALAAGAVGCTSARTGYEPKLVARGELLLQYDDDGLAMNAGGKRVASAYGWDGLEPFVACVPQAKEHAQQAAHAGSVAGVLSAVAVGGAVAGLGGLAGLAFYNSKPNAMYALFGAGIAVEIGAVVMAGLSRKYKNEANGHAVDAANHYNDAVGSLGATCSDLKYPPPSVLPPEPEEPAPAPAATPAPPPEPAPP